MTRFYSKTTGGFYDDTIHGTMPEDAVEISDDLYEYVFGIQSEGGSISSDSNGKPIGVACSLSSEKRSVLRQIAAIENTITDRRRDEAILGIDIGWLASTRQQINELRVALPAS
jgi:hypothetical protein